MATLTSAITLFTYALGATYACGKFFDDVVRSSVKTEFAKFLRGLTPTNDPTATIHTLARDVLNASFGTSVVALRAVLGSLTVTALGGTLVFLTLLALLAIYKPSAPILAIISDPLTFAKSLGTTFAISALVDYLSLSKSLLIVNSGAFSNQPFRHYLLDLAISIALALGWFFTILSFLFIKGALGPDGSKIASGFEPMAFSVLCLITAFVPTLITLFFCLLTIFARISFIASRPVKHLIERILDIDEKPFSSAVVMSWLLLMPLFWLWVAIAG